MTIKHLLFLSDPDSEKSILSQQYMNYANLPCISEIINEEELTKNKFERFPLFGTNPRISFVIPNGFDGNQHSQLPALFTPYSSPKEVFLSFEGIKSVIRYSLLNKERLREVSKWKREIKTFYLFQNYSKGRGFGEPQKLVTCFDEDCMKIFQGQISRAPINFEKEIERHPYKNWRNVGVKIIGKLEKILQKKNENGFVICPEKNLVIFPDEINTLKAGKPIITGSYKNIYEVCYEAYFNDKGNIYELRAYMLN